MAIDLDVLDAQIDGIIDALNESQVDSISIEISAGYVAGLEAGEEKKSMLQSTSESLTNVQVQAIAKLSTQYFGRIQEINSACGATLKAKAQEIIATGGSQAELEAEIRSYAQDLFGGKESVVIDRTGLKKTYIEVLENKSLRTAEKTITRPYVTTVDVYSEMLARTAPHAAYEEGRASAYQEEGLEEWRFVGPVDERSRPDHSALVGEHFEYGTDQSDMALQLLHDPNCRHRAIPYFGDPELDTPMEEYEKQKEAAGLYWDETKMAWAFRDL